MKQQCTEKRFLDDVKEHELTIIKDDGCFRHLRVGGKDSNTYYYNITTWPGYLCISGDMGCFVFARTEDMFRFFRMDKSDFNYNNDKQLQINDMYWHEKLKAVSRFGGDVEYDEEYFRSVVWKYFKNWYEDVDDGPEDDTGGLRNKEKTREELQEMLDYNDVDTYNRAYDVATNFKSHDGNEFIDLQEYDFNCYTFHFIWCLYAIVYAIKLYDIEKEKENV